MTTEERAGQEQSSSLYQRIVKQYRQDGNQQSTSHSGARADQINEKRKKFMEAYQKNSMLQNYHDTKEGQPSHSRKGVSEIPSGMRAGNPASSMLIDERNSTEESLQNEQASARYRDILRMAKNKFKSKSQVPPHMMIKQTQSSFDSDSPHIQGSLNPSTDLPKPNFQNHLGQPAQ